MNIARLNSGTIGLKGNFFDGGGVGSYLFRTKGFFDWYIEYDALKKYTAHIGLEKDAKILMVGCGNSSKFTPKIKILKLQNSASKCSTMATTI
jgi:hypothetical protein